MQNAFFKNFICHYSDASYFILINATQNVFLLEHLFRLEQVFRQNK